MQREREQYFNDEHENDDEEEISLAQLFHAAALACDDSAEKAQRAKKADIMRKALGTEGCSNLENNCFKNNNFFLIIFKSNEITII
jgi:hypothetical protein